MKLAKPLTLFCLLLVFTAGKAQTKIYATLNSSSHADNTANIDGNLSTASRVNAYSGVVIVGGAYSGYVELQFSSVLSAGTPSYIKINTQDNLLSSLVGGSLGELLSDIAGNLLTGDQRFTVQAKNGTNVVLQRKSEDDGAFADEQMRVVVDESGNYYIRIVPQSSYNRIRVTNRLSSTIALGVTKWLDVYDAFTISGSASCGIGNYASFGSTGLTTGLLELGNTGVANPEYAIDSDTANYSQLNIGILGVAASVQETIHFEGFTTMGDRYTIKLQADPSLIAVGLLTNVTIEAYDESGNSQSVTLNSLLTADLLGILQTGDPVSVPFYPEISADRITVKLSTLASVAVTQSLKLYGVVKGDFDVSVDGGGTCQVNDAMSLTATVNGCNAPYSYMWSGDVSGTSATAIPSTATPGIYNYSLKVTDKYGIDEWQSAQIEVEEPPVAGTVSESQAVCSGDEPADLTVSGYTGNIVRWESADNEDFDNPVTIDNTTNTLSGAGIGPLTATRYYRAVVVNNSYPEVYAEPAALTVKTSVWNGSSWSNGVPDIATTIYFTGNYNEAADLYGCSLEVSDDAQVTIPSGYNVVLNGAVKVYSGTFTLENNANLLQENENAVNIGNIIVKKNSSELYRLDYTLWSSPVTGSQTLYEFSPSTLSNRFYTYLSDQDLFTPVNPEETIFEAGKGFLIRMPNSNPLPGYNTGETPMINHVQFTGTPNNGDVSIPLDIQGGRYNMIGNPYPSPVNIFDFFDANEDVLDPGAPLYFWRKKNNSQASTYALITKAAYVANMAIGGNEGEELFGGIIWDDFFNSETPNAQWIINPGQGFFVKAAESGGTVIFNNSMRRMTNNGQFFRTGNPEENNISRLWLNMRGEGRKFSQIAVMYSPFTTLGTDYGYDGRCNTDGDLVLYSIIPGESFAIQARPAFNDEDVVQLGYKVQVAGEYNISLNRVDGIFAQQQPVYLKDNYLNIIHDLAEGSYHFTTVEGECNNRFELVYRNEVLNTNAPLTKNSVIVYKAAGNLEFDSGQINMLNIAVYDVRGSLLYNSKDIQANHFTIKSIQPSEKIVLINIVTTGGIVHKKMLL